MLPLMHATERVAAAHATGWREAPGPAWCATADVRRGEAAARGTAEPATRLTPPRRLFATRYVTALREGGSVPAVVEADDAALYVVKFRAAAQGGRVLAAEMVVGELARAAGLPVPELALIDVDAAL